MNTRKIVDSIGSVGTIGGLVVIAGDVFILIFGVVDIVFHLGIGFRMGDIVDAGWILVALSAALFVQVRFFNFVSNRLADREKDRLDELD